LHLSSRQGGKIRLRSIQRCCGGRLFHVVEFLRAKRPLCAALDNATSILPAARLLSFRQISREAAYLRPVPGAASCLSDVRSAVVFLRLAGCGRGFHRKCGLEAKRRARPRVTEHPQNYGLNRQVSDAFQAIVHHRASQTKSVNLIEPVIGDCSRIERELFRKRRLP